MGQGKLVRRLGNQTPGKAIRHLKPIFLTNHAKTCRFSRLSVTLEGLLRDRIKGSADHRATQCLRCISIDQAYVPNVLSVSIGSQNSSEATDFEAEIESSALLRLFRLSVDTLLRNFDVERAWLPQIHGPRHPHQGIAGEPIARAFSVRYTRPACK